MVTLATDGVVVTGATDGGELTLRPVDEVIVATGGRPDLSMRSELRLALDREGPIEINTLVLYAGI